MTHGSVARAADVLLADGRIASIRPMVGEDEAELIALHDEVDDDNLRLRFFSLNRESAHRYVEHLVQQTGNTVATLVATVRNRIVAVATAERAGPDSAEVAFLVADEEHGHGLGSLLLEHLAAACRDNGVRLFVAEVLPENAAMIRVFRDVGFDVSRRSHSGVVSVEMSTEASSNAIAAADLRESVSEAHSLAPLLYPKTVAVVGVRREGAGLGHAVLASILKGGFRGRVFVVHPEVPSIDGVTAFPRLADVPGHIDVAIIAVPAIRVLAAVEDAADAGASSVVVISSGLGELGPEGAEIQRQMVRVARRNNIRLVGPNCLGVMSNDPGISLNATFSLSDPPPGGLAVASQSGGVGIALLDVARELGLGVHSFISLGNKADVSGNDLLAAWIDDPQVTAAALYLESFGNATKFARLARRFAERKPLLAVVGGRSAGGQRAGASHTAAAASPAVGVDALFAQAGVIACRSAEAMGRTALLLSEQPLPIRTEHRHRQQRRWPRCACRRRCGRPGARRPGAAGPAPRPTRRTRVRHDRHQQSDRPRCRSHGREPVRRCRTTPGQPRGRHPARGPGADQRRAGGAPGRGDRPGRGGPSRQARRPGRPGRPRRRRSRRHRLPRGRPCDRGHRSGSRLRRVEADAARRSPRTRPGPRVRCARGRT